MSAKKLRLSHSLISLWERGDTQGAVDLYFHLDRPGTKAMEDGKKFHEDMAQHIQTHSSFPDWFFNYPLKLPETEKEVVVSYNEICDLKGIFDCYDPLDKSLFEFKTGVSDSLEWARSGQIPMYFLISELAKIDVERAFLIHYNKKSDFCIIHNSQKLRDKARNVIDSVLPEIHSFFLENGLI